MLKPDPQWRASCLEAFEETLNVAGLTILVLVSLLVGKWEPAAFGLAAEAAYLAIAPNMRVFRSRAAARAAKAGEQAFEKERAAWMRRLDAQSQGRAQKLAQIRADIFRINGVDVSSTEAGLLGEDMLKLDSLFLSYLRLLYLKKEYEAHLVSENPESIRRDLERFTDQAGGGSGDAAAARNADILKKRLEHLSQIGDLLKNLEMRLAEIENGFSLVGDQVMEMKSGGEVSQNLTSLLADVEATEQVVKETAPVLEQLRQSKTA